MPLQFKHSGHLRNLETSLPIVMAANWQLRWIWKTSSLTVPSIWSQSLLSAEPALKTMTFALSLSHPYTSRRPPIPTLKVYIYIFCKAAKGKHQKEPSCGISSECIQRLDRESKEKVSHGYCVKPISLLWNVFSSTLGAVAFTRPKTPSESGSQ